MPVPPAAHVRYLADAGGEEGTAAQVRRAYGADAGAVQGEVRDRWHVSQD